MEFHEKLRNLRKDRGITQEELAEVLYVSRTAVSKWESGKGYPSIDSLIAISKYFEVTVDELLSVEKVISIAQKENKSNILSICDVLFAAADISSLLFVLLPFYPNFVNGYVYSVNLFAYSQVSDVNIIFYWVLFLVLALVGSVGLTLAKLKVKKGSKLCKAVSMGLSFALVIFLALAREAYATAFATLLLFAKVMLLIKRIKTSGTD